MNSALSLRLEQSQKLLMTPELRKAIELLQLTAAELDGYLYEQALENPLLEIQDKWLEFPVGIHPERLKSSPQWKNECSRLSDKKATTPLQDVILEVECFRIDEQVKLAANALLNSLDERGFIPVIDAALCSDLRVDFESLVAGKQLLKSLDIAGLGAACLQESIMFQLERSGKLSDLARLILEQDLLGLADRPERMAIHLNVPLSSVTATLQEIKKCHPYPAQHLFERELPGSIVPDMDVQQHGQDFIVKLREQRGKVSVNTSYLELMQAGGDAECRIYLREHLRAASWLMRSLEQRQETLLQVSQAIVRFQRAFLLMGKEHLRPLTLLEVAQEVGVHESTVSRAVSHKHAMTPRGLLPLKFFFGSGVKGVAGSIAAEAVKERMMRIIKHEDRANPVSDERITHILAREGISISRRTVAKYREGLGVMSSADRKRYDIMG